MKPKNTYTLSEDENIPKRHLIAFVESLSRPREILWTKQIHSNTWI